MPNQFEYMGEGIHKVKVPRTVDHASIKSQIMTELEDDLSNLVRAIIKNKAIEMRYDSPESMASYAGYINTYQKEAKGYIAWRSAMWDWVSNYMLDVTSGKITPPLDLTTLISALPKIDSYKVV